MNTFHRYEGHRDCTGMYLIHHTLFVELRETPKGYWIIPYELTSSVFDDKVREKGKHWVSKTAIKRYAYPSRKQAFKSLKKRTKKRVEILKSQLCYTEGLVGHLHYYDYKDAVDW